MSRYAFARRDVEYDDAYDEWCEGNGVDPDDDETASAYVDWIESRFEAWVEGEAEARRDAR